MNIILLLLGTLTSLRRLPSRVLLFNAAILLSSLCALNTALAGSATWTSNPASGDWNTAANWTPQVIPNAASDTATFATSNRTAVSLSGDTEVNGIVFNAGASAFTITVNSSFTLNISGLGVTNNSGVTQHFVGSHGTIVFANSASAGNGTFTNNGGTASGAYGGITAFFGASTAGDGTFTSNAAAVVDAFEGAVEFHDTSSAGNGTFTVNGATVAGVSGGFMQFFDSSTAGNATFTLNGGTGSRVRSGGMYFRDGSTTGNATLIANAGLNGGRGGQILFFQNHSSGTARVELFGNGNLDITSSFPGVAVGSIEGSGKVFLGSRNLTVGSNNLSTTFSSVISDGGNAGGIGGSLTKVGTGSLSLTKPNTYTGVTTINSGALLVKNTVGSATGTGPVQLNAGRLGGTGIIAGTVTVGTGSSSGAILLPGNSPTKPANLTINSALTFNALSTYKCVLNRSNMIGGEVTALGVTINPNATFAFVETGTGTLSTGTVFTAINNTAANPIAGTFSNLPDGFTFTSNGNTYQANYEGGDGNDLTLTVQ